VAEFVAQEEMGRLRGFWWSPDGRTLAVQRTDHAPVELLHVADPMHPERPPTPFRYPRAGGKNAEVELVLIPRAGGAGRGVRWDRARFPYLAKVTWPERGPLTIIVQNRAQTEEQVLAVDAQGATRLLVEERDEAWINLDPGAPSWLDDGSGFLWSSERGGAWQLELRGPDGALVRVLTPPELGYRGVVGVDEQRKVVWVVASADPRSSQVFRVPLDGGPPQQVTRGEGVHEVVLGKSGVYALTSTLLDGTRRREVFAADDRRVGELESVAEAPPYLPVVELQTVQVDGREHHAALVLPRELEAGRRYPVLVDVYGGPHVSVVKATPWAYLLDQWLADTGFIVVRIDGRGTPGRGRTWERAIARDLATVPLADQIAVLDALFAKNPALDPERVAISGWSFGGYMAALAVLRRPDRFRAGVAGAPVTDWRNYDTHYTERYMGLVEDNLKAYEATSLVASAGALERPLLIVHGTTDDNVHLRHALELGDALFRAGRPFELLPLNGFTHMVPDPAVKRALYGRIVGFLRRSLD
jgi:dipeptidyl-peptidase-4